MTNTWLLLDVNNLLHRSFHAIKGRLSHNGKQTGMLFGFFRDLVSLQEKFNTKNVVFCFDSLSSLREKIYPKYRWKRKLKRKEYSHQESEAHESLWQDMQILRKQHLPEIGYRNILIEKGYEADDHIASCVQYLYKQENTEIIMVSSDKDLYQLLSSKCIMYNLHSKSVESVETFVKEYGIDPSEWADVKCIGGCVSDDIEGVKGVAEKKAIQYLNGDMNAETKTHENIEKAITKGIFERNRPVVILPFSGCPQFEPKKDEVSKSAWLNVMKQLGISSLILPTIIQELY